MRRSTIPVNQDNKVRLWAVLVWMAVWQIASIVIGQEILLASPLAAAVRLVQLAMEGHFWRSIAFSMGRIAAGFLLALLVGTVCAVGAAFCRPVRELLQPLMAVMKSTPIASIIILCLIWLSPDRLSLFIAFLMVTPIVYTNVLEGIRRADPKLLEMAALFGVRGVKLARYVYLSEVMPYFSAACTVSLGLCWKAGVAAEVIGIPANSIGENLYKAKVYLETADLFAWTVVIIAASLLFEKVFLWALRCVVHRLERM